MDFGEEFSWWKKNNNHGKKVRKRNNWRFLWIPKVPLISTTGLQRQPSVGNVLARTSSFGSAVGPLLPRQSSAGSDSSLSSRTGTSSNNAQRQRSPSGGSPLQHQNSGGNATGNGVLRQGSQGSLFEQIASQAKDLVRETTRQSSQDGLLAHMDKVEDFLSHIIISISSIFLSPIFSFFWTSHSKLLFLPVKTSSEGENQRSWRRQSLRSSRTGKIFPHNSNLTKCFKIHVKKPNSCVKISFSSSYVTSLLSILTWLLRV